MSKSFVTMAQKQCAVCGTMYDTGELLLDKRMRNRFDNYTCIGYGLCPEHQSMADDGYIAVVAVSEDRKTMLGAVAHIRRSAWDKVFNSEAPSGPVAHCDMSTIEAIKAKYEEANAS